MTYKTPRWVAHNFLMDVVIPYQGDDCLDWPFKRDGCGYGVHYVKKRDKQVHRTVCEAVHGPAPSPAHEVAHSCNRGAFGCVNPKHLRWATHAENMADGRTRHGGRPDPTPHPTWELVPTITASTLRGYAPQLKLSAEQVVEIRALRGKLSIPKIAERYGVGESQVSKIHRRLQWKHVE
jgi:hypothetical protein